MKLATGFVAAATAFSPLSFAQTERDLGSHEHGSALLNVAIDGNLVFVELQSPWNNLVGFEHSPKTTEQQAMVDDATAQLELPNELFVFTGSQCVSAGVVIESAMGSDEHHDDHDEDEHDDHGEDKHDDHDEDKHDDHSEDGTHEKDDDHDKDGEHDDHHDADHDDEESESHSSLLASYSFECTNASELTSIDVRVLERWSGFEELDVQLIGPSGQSLSELVPGQSVVDFTAVQ